MTDVLDSLENQQQWKLTKQQQQPGDVDRPDGGDVSLQGGYEQEGEGGEAVPQHDGQGDPQDPACGAILPVPNGPWGPALMPGNWPQHSIPCTITPLQPCGLTCAGQVTSQTPRKCRITREVLKL